MKVAKRLVFIFVVLALFVGRALSDRNGEAVTGTRSFAIDGRRFRVDDSAVGGSTVLERELAGRGVDMLRVSEDLGSVIPPESVEPLREEPPDKDVFQLPRGLQPDHVLKLDTATGPVAIAIGRMDRGEKNIVGRLRSAGWECRESDALGSAGAVAQVTKGAETYVVLLDTEESRFLAIRRAVR